MTSAPVRISAPAAFAADAIACVTAPIPPTANHRRARGMRICRRADQQHQRASCRPRPQKCPEHAASRNHRAQQLCFKIFRRQIRHCHRPPAQQAKHVSLSQFADRAPGLQHAPQIAAAGMVDVRRRGRQRFGNDLADLPQRLLEIRDTSPHPSARMPRSPAPTSSAS